MAAAIEYSLSKSININTPKLEFTQYLNWILHFCYYDLEQKVNVNSGFTKDVNWFELQLFSFLTIWDLYKQYMDVAT